MREDFERKLTKSEFDNLMGRFNRWFSSPKSLLEIFEYFMERGSYTWTQNGFTNRIGLLYKTHSDTILHKATNNKQDMEILKTMIDDELGQDKHYFLYTNYHKDPQMWRLEDNRCVWGMVHESHRPLQGQYFIRLKEIKEKQREQNLTEFFSKYVEAKDTQCLELEESDINQLRFSFGNESQYNGIKEVDL